MDGLSARFTRWARRAADATDQAHAMPGTEIARKQHTLGGAAGLVVLGLALAYRFFPGVLHVEPQLQPQVATTSPVQRAPTPN